MSGEKSGGRLRPAWLILAVMILIQLGVTVYCYEVKKTGIYSDEIWSYGLANGYYKPFIYLEEGISIDDTDGYRFDNFDEWINGSVFEDYITVQRGERFAYRSVVSNNSLDHHPPFYYMLLHTVCSFFPDSFSYRYAFAISCVCLVFTTLYLYRLSGILFDRQWKRLMVTGFYAFGSGALSTFIYLRQYNLLTMLVVMSVYYSARVYKDETDGGLSLARALPPLLVTSLLAFSTHYYGIIFTGLMTAFMCLWFLFRKRIKNALIYGGSMLLALGAFIALYPAAVRQLLSSGDLLERKMTYGELLRILLNYTVGPTLGIRVNLMRSSAGALIPIVLAALVLLLVPVMVLVRREAWFVRAAGAVKRGVTALPKKIAGTDRLFIMILLSALISLLLINVQVNAFTYKEYISRYVFFLYPFICLTVFYAADAVLGILPDIKGRKVYPVLLTALLAAAEIRTWLLFPSPYFFDVLFDKDEIRQTLAGSNCLLVLCGDEGREAYLENFPALLGLTNKSCCVTIEGLEDKIEYVGESGVQIDYLLVDARNYVLSDRQYEVLEKLLADNGAGEDFPYGFRYDSGMSEDYGGDQQQDEVGEKYLLLNKDTSDILESVCPDEEYDPLFLQNVNGGIYIVLKHRT